MGKREREKGKSFEQFVRKVFEEALGVPFETGRQAGMNNKTIPDVYNRRWFSIECKDQKNLNVWAALDQARARLIEGSQPIVASNSQRKGKRPVLSVTLDLRLFLRILVELAGREGPLEPVTINRDMTHEEIETTFAWVRKLRGAQAPS